MKNKEYLLGLLDGWTEAFTHDGSFGQLWGRSYVRDQIYDPDSIELQDRLWALDDKWRELDKTYRELREFIKDVDDD